MRRWHPPLASIGSTFVILGAAIWLLQAHLTWWTAPIAFLAIGFMQYRLVLASHEATHRTLLQPVWLNELAGLFCASLVGVSLFNYRRAHLEHHKYPQSIEDDIDGYIYRPLITAPPGWRRFVLLFTGNYRDVLTKLRRKFFGDGDLEGTHALVGASRPGIREVAEQVLPLLLMQAMVAALFWWQIGWWSYFVFWLLPIFTIALQLDRVRTFLEHGYNYFFPGPPIPDLGEAPQSTIDVETTFLERYLFAPFGFSDHQAHHAQLTVPFYNLPELRRLLESHQPGYVRRIRASYFVILARMIRAPLAPGMAERLQEREEKGTPVAFAE
jgi:fatty acid desaturase